MLILRRAPALVVEAPALDARQRAAVAQRAPIARVLGGPGTGKSTLSVEIVLDRVDRLGLTPDQCLVLAPTRLAAAALRDRLTARLARTSTAPLARTHQAFGFAVLRREAALRGAPAPRLLSGPEQDVVLRELLAGHQASRTGPTWPQRVAAALDTRGFRAELRDLLMRAVEHGVDAARLAELGRHHDRPEWVSAAAVLNEYDEVTALSQPGAYDPAWILTAAADLLDDDHDALDRVREQIRLIVVDDAQELTWAAARLLRTIAHPGMQLVLIGDPDSAVQTFRGADPRLLWWDRWPDLGEAPTEVLGTAYRTPARLHRAAGEVVRRIGATGGADRRESRPVHDGGELQVVLARSVAQEAGFIASSLRRAHLQGGMPWRDMAVLVRGRGRAGTLRRVLAAAGVPLTPPEGDVPVRDEVAVRPLLMLLDLCVRLARDPAAMIAPTEAVDLCLSVLGGGDAVSLRRLRRALRRIELDAGGRRSSDELLAAALGDPVLSAHSGPDGEPLRRLTRAILAGVQAAARTADGTGWAPEVSPESVLWAIWSALGLAASWRRAALEGGSRGGRADRDLDAVVGLFDAAARYADRLPGSGPDAFLDHVRGEEVPGDTLALRAPALDTVAVLTPAAAAGREWRLVCVAGVQEGVWPDLRLRGSLLGSERLVDVVTGRGGSVRAAQAAVRYDETRLFHVAVTRASERLIVSAVRNDDELPSVYLDVLDPQADGDRNSDSDSDRHSDSDIGRPFTPFGRALTTAGVVGALRQVAASVTDPVAAARAGRHLARLADDGVTGADPTQWWSLVPAADGRPRRAPDQTVRVSPSKVEQFATCELAWLLRASGGDGVKSPSASIGTLVHDVLAELGDVDAPTLQAQIERRWAQLGLTPGWVEQRQRDEARAMAGRAAAYFTSAAAAEWERVGVEVDAQVQVGRALLSGRVDRLERHTDGALRVIDYKTGSSKPSAAELARHPQLGVYQAAVESGAFSELGSRSAGAALLQLGKASNKSVTLQSQPALAADEDPTWARRLIETTADGMGGSRFAATPGEHCRMCPVLAACPARPEGQRS